MRLLPATWPALLIMPPLTTIREEVPNGQRGNRIGNRIQSKPDIQAPVDNDNNYYKVIRGVVWWLITLAWATQIFYLSTAPFSSSRSESLLAEMLASVHLNVSAYTLGIVNSLLRKFAHLIQYSIFCLLLYRCLGGWNRWRPHLARWCVLAAAIYALTDEFHQTLVPGRGPSLIDCGIDTIGAALAMLLVYQRARFLQRDFPTPD